MTGAQDVWRARGTDREGAGMRETFRALHHGAGPLLLPNAWDHASAAALFRRGFPALGTTSLGVAAAAGFPDGSGVTRAVTLDLGRRLALLPVPVSVDIEGGFSDEPGQVAALAAELALAGVAGVNIEDGLQDGRLADLSRQTDKLAAVREAAPGLFVNARTDTHWLRTEPTVAGALRRCEAYVAAGADGVFVPGLVDDAGIAALVSELSVPLNVLYAQGRTSWRRLAELGVGRVSLGSLLYRAALGHAVRTAAAVAGPEAYGGLGDAPSDAPCDDPGDVPGYGEVQALAELFG